jgi:hypothetical protein
MPKRMQVLVKLLSAWEIGEMDHGIGAKFMLFPTLFDSSM